MFKGLCDILLGVNWSSSCREVKNLICQVTSQGHMTEESCDNMGGIPLW